MYVLCFEEIAIVEEKETDKEDEQLDVNNNHNMTQ